jgi:hemolysin III
VSELAAGALEAAARPRLRGVSHLIAFGLSAVAGGFLIAGASGVIGRLAAAVFGTTVATMFGASALYHRVRWGTAAKRWMRRVDHAGIYLLIGGSYTPFALFALDGAWQIGVLAAAWAGVALGIALRFAWVDAPGWLSATIALSLGWISIVALPEAFGGLGLGAFGLLLAGGLLYSLGGLVYALRRPNPFPATFGFHEVFHALVVVAVACHYGSVALVVASGS